MLQQMFHRTTSEMLKYVAVEPLVIMTQLTPEQYMHTIRALAMS